jgi:hypothetical protein
MANGIGRIITAGSINLANKLYGFINNAVLFNVLNMNSQTSNATDAGPLFNSGSSPTGVSSNINGFSCAQLGIFLIKMLITIQTAVSIGTLSSARSAPVGVSGSIYGFICGGSSNSNVIDYINLTTTTQNALDCGDLVLGRHYTAGLSGRVYGFTCGGAIATGSFITDSIEYINLSTATQNALDGGNLTAVAGSIGGVS